MSYANPIYESQSAISLSLFAEGNESIEVNKPKQLDFYPRQRASRTPTRQMSGLFSPETWPIFLAISWLSVPTYAHRTCHTFPRRHAHAIRARNVTFSSAIKNVWRHRENVAHLMSHYAELETMMKLGDPQTGGLWPCHPPESTDTQRAHQSWMGQSVGVSFTNY